VILEGGDEKKYDRLLVATGGRNRQLPIQRTHLRGVYQLRTLGDADHIKAEADPGRRAIVIGMGFIGAEVTASLRQRGVEVTTIEPSATPLYRAFGPDVGGVLAEIHREKGVELLLGETPVQFEGDVEVRGVRTSSGRVLHCDFAIVGVGIEPVVDFLEGSGVALDNGVLVDEFARTNVPDVYAAGDIANHFNPVLDRRIRVEHYNNAEWQGQAAAVNLLGREQPYAAIPNFWSNQYEYDFEYRGHHAEVDEIVVRGSLQERNFLALYVKDSRVTAALGLNRNEELEAAEKLIARRAQIPSERLRDENVEIKTLAA
jgi:3-phenylpropionate/trans-cinnamate dioxygenase ferredoxin reductase subunit